MRRSRRKSPKSILAYGTRPLQGLIRCLEETDLCVGRDVRAVLDEADF